MKLRMLGDRILLKPLDWDASKTIIAIRHGRPVRGQVIAVGPGANPKKYQDGPKGKRSLMVYSKRFQPTEVKVGDIVELGGLNIFDGAGYAFHEEWIDGVKHIIVEEGDVAIVREPCDDYTTMAGSNSDRCCCGHPMLSHFKYRSLGINGAKVVEL